jgi:hypothetical protein
MKKNLNHAAAASLVEIDVLVVIDTDYVIANYPNPSQNQNSPTFIDHNSQYMIASDARGIISGQGTATLNFRAFPNDIVKFRGTSIYQNSDAAVIVYGVEYWYGDQVFNNFNSDKVTRAGAVMPNQNGNGLPAETVKLNFMSLDSTVSNAGTENFYVYFALYVCNDGENQSLYGYYAWDPAITVS